MANGIQPSGYFTQVPEIGGGSGAMSNLLDPMDPAGAYRAFLAGRLYPSEVGDYSNLTSTSPLTSGGPFNLLPTPEGALTLGVGAINPLFGILTRGAINARNAEALETLANQGILQVVEPAEPSSGLGKFMGNKYTPGTGQYRLAPETEKAILETGQTPKDYFESQFQSQYGDANDLARYLNQIAYTTQGEFFTEDLFGNPTAWSKYVDRQGNIKPDALENWKKFGAQDKRGMLNMFDKKDQGTQAGTMTQGTSGGGSSMEAPTGSQQTSGGGNIPIASSGILGLQDRSRYAPENPFKAAAEAGPGSREAKVAENIRRNIKETGTSGYKRGVGFTRGR